MSSLARDGSVPALLRPRPVYNDIAAPGEDIFSTLPRALTRENPSCVDQGYSDCGPADFRHAEGTSFAAPQVTAAAALLLAQAPSLSADQVATLLERSADDLNASNGCVELPAASRFAFRLGTAQHRGGLTPSTKGALPPADRFETNDDVGAHAARLCGARGTSTATVDYWDDPTDVYPIDLAARRRLPISLTGAAAPGAAPPLEPAHAQRLRRREQARGARSKQVGEKQRLRYLVPCRRERPLLPPGHDDPAGCRTRTS